MGKILSFGELLLRLSSPGYTKLFQKDSFETSFCGGEANVAVSLAKFGLKSQFVTKLPDNDVGHAAVDSMRYFGVDMSKVLYGAGRMGLYYIEKGASQRPSKIIYDRTYSAVSMALPSEFDWEVIFDDVEWFHWTGISPALSDNMVSISEEACRIAKKKGIVVSCDLNYRKNLWDSERAQRVMKTLLPYVDVCVANEEDAEKTLGITIQENDIENGKLNRNGYEKVAKTIHTLYGCKKVAITLRESYSASRNGWSAVLYDGVEDQIFCSVKYDIQIVDRVGGGDSFTAGLIYGIATQMNNQNIIDFATAASCLKQTMEGDFNRTTVADVEELLKSGGSGRVQR